MIILDYRAIYNNLQINLFQNVSTHQREKLLCDIERALIKELKLIKFFRLEYDHEEHINNEKKLLYDIVV